MKTVRTFLFTIIFCVISSPFAFSLSVKSLSLEQIVIFSEVIARGTLLERKVEVDTEESGFLVIYYTFRIDECLKGYCGEKMTVKQLADQGLPDFKVGQPYLVFYPEASENTGLVAPVGIWQGKFDLEQKEGKWLIPALKQNQRLKSLALPSPANSYEAFKKVILKLVGEVR